MWTPRSGSYHLLQNVSAAFSDPRCNDPIRRVGLNGDKAFPGHSDHSPARNQRLQRISSTPKPPRKLDKRTFCLEADQAGRYQIEASLFPVIRHVRSAAPRISHATDRALYWPRTLVRAGSGNVAPFIVADAALQALEQRADGIGLR